MLRIVQGTIGRSRATSIRAIAVAPNAHSRRQAQRTAAKATKAPATSVYSGRNIAVAPKRNPGRSHRHELFPSAAHKNARIAAGRVSIAGGSLMISPTEWMNGG